MAYSAGSLPYSSIKAKHTAIPNRDTVIPGKVHSKVVLLPKLSTNFNATTVPKVLVIAIGRDATIADSPVLENPAMDII